MKKEIQNRKKSAWINIAIMVVMGVVLFTPLGTEVKVLFNRLIAFSPDLEEKIDEEQVDFSSWQLKNEKGEAVAFSEFKGKLILINFWATWCPPCIAEKPSFQKLYDDYKDRVVFLFVTSDPLDKVVAYKQKHHYNLPMYFPLSPAPKLLESSSIPASFLIDQQGRIVLKKFSAGDWNSAGFRRDLDKLLVGVTP
ncbi:TlpA disulfide reductase family protein [Flavobacterium sp. NKUCC04_CG]|uniref:TlpA family protein disulfide reductase n=1 Tax=Flavobacterium sp. NKUCC04_CG TaxID=2842121 RepID=UPI001C5AB63D|nr:TlpA disulfide reductase family protein [Flavobacterium sp. NKUCC04_CG]MBW3520463.1 TlpA family protein disulfide reductase [Flavobacterium sp. NKUCC04_CG]